MNNQYDHLVDALQALELQGPLLRFEIQSQGLVALDSGTCYQPKDLEIIEFHRFEGDTDPDDMAILYLLETRDGERGVIIDAYGTYSNAQLGKFIKQVPIRDLKA